VIGERRYNKRQRRDLYQHGAKPHVQTCTSMRAESLAYPLSIPQIPFIKFHAILFQKCLQFILKCHLAMMRFLHIDITNQCIQIRRSNRKRTISALPCELFQRRRLSLEPLRRRLQFFHQLSHIRRAGQADGKMNVIGNSSNPEAFAFGIAGDGGKISVKVGEHSSVKDRRAIFCAENNMNKKECKRLRHCGDYRSGLQPSYAIGNSYMGQCPMLV
jgi:hypothetical protein